MRFMSLASVVMTCAVVVSTGAIAQTPAQPGPERMAAMAADAILSRADANRDGALDASEMNALGRMMGRQGGLDARGWARGDVDRDGRISRREMIEVFKVEIARSAAARRGR